MNIDEKHKERCNTKRKKFKELHIDGPWMSEPDKVHWKHKGMDCLILRNSEMFNLCGYVGVKPGHPFFEKHYDDVNVDAHGGLTYSDHCSGSVCHTTNEEDDIWWLGFDCAHSGDEIPGMLIMNATIPELQAIHDKYPKEQEHYHTVEEVKAEVERLAAFVSAL